MDVSDLLIGGGRPWGVDEGPRFGNFNISFSTATTAQQRPTNILLAWPDVDLG